MYFVQHVRTLQVLVVHRANLDNTNQLHKVMTAVYLATSNVLAGDPHPNDKMETLRWEFASPIADPSGLQPYTA